MEEQKCVKSAWTHEEDTLLRQQIQRLGGPGNWTAIAERLPGRSSKSCRLRWCNQLNPSVKRGPFTPEEDAKILVAHAIHGNKWAVISRSMPGRTDNQVKNRFNSTLRRTLAQNGKLPLPSPKRTNSSSTSAGSQKASGAVGSKKNASNQMVKQASLKNASLKRVGSSIMETMSCDDSMQSTQDNGGSKEMTSKAKRAKKSPKKMPSHLGKNTRGPSQEREDSGGSESVGLETLIQASLLELQRIKSGKNSSGFEIDTNPANALGGFGAAADKNNTTTNNNNINNNNDDIKGKLNGTAATQTLRSCMSMENLFAARVQQPLGGQLSSSMSMENLFVRGQMMPYAPFFPNDAFDWRNAGSPFALYGTPFRNLSAHLATQLASMPPNSSNSKPSKGSETAEVNNQENDPRSSSALSTPITITPNLASSWYGRMLENLGWRTHFPFEVLPQQEQ